MTAYIQSNHIEPMGKYVRRKIGEQIRMRKRLKTPLRITAESMPYGFADEDFFLTFQKAYPNLWNEVKVKYETDLTERSNRIKKGLKVSELKKPSEITRDVASHILKKTRAIHKNLKDDQKAALQVKHEALIRKGERKSEEIKAKRTTAERSFQKATPKFAQQLIKEYFRLRRSDPLDIDARYLILLECAKFKCKQVTIFLHKINACEKNIQLRRLAYNILEKFGQYPRLGRIRKGKRGSTTIKTVGLEENPTELLQFIYAKQHIIHQSFDVFLSHSYRAKNELLAMKDRLNSQGLVVYVDWINDAEMLAREKQNEDTFNVIFERLKQSKSLLFLACQQSLLSENTKKEVEFYKTLSRPIYYVNPDSISPLPEFLDGAVKWNLNTLKSCKSDKFNRE